MWTLLLILFPGPFFVGINEDSLWRFSFVSVLFRRFFAFFGLLLVFNVVQSFTGTETVQDFDLIAFWYADRFPDQIQAHVSMISCSFSRCNLDPKWQQNLSTSLSDPAASHNEFEMSSNWDRSGRQLGESSWQFYWLRPFYSDGVVSEFDHVFFNGCNDTKPILVNIR